MVNGKKCVNVSGNDLMCRIEPNCMKRLLKKNGCRAVYMKGREYKGFVGISEETIQSKKELDYWLELALDVSKRAKASEKKR